MKRTLLWLCVQIALVRVLAGIPFFGAGRFNFNNNLQAAGQQDPRQSVFDLLDHLEETYKKLNVSHVPLPMTGFSHEDLKIGQKQASVRVEQCQITVCKIVNSFSLNAIDIPQRAMRKVESRSADTHMEDFCFEVASYYQTKLGLKQDGMLISSAYISGNLKTFFDQARAAKAVAVKMMRSLLQKTLDYQSFKCSLTLMKEYLRNELASYHQAYQHKNYINGVRMKVRSLRSKILQLKRLSADKVNLERRLNSTKVDGVRAVLVRTRLEALAHSLSNKLTNADLVKECLDGAKTLERGRMSTFTKLWGTARASTTSGYSVVIMKHDRTNMIVLAVNLDFKHEAEESLSPAVLVASKLTSGGNGTHGLRQGPPDRYGQRALHG